MDKIQELAELLLPEGILEYFECASYERKSKEESKPYGEVTITLVVYCFRWKWKFLNL